MQRSTLFSMSALPVAADGPAYVVGQDGEGHWLAVEMHGHGGGLFASRDAAVSYARREASRRAGAVVFAAGPIIWELAEVAPLRNAA